MKMMKTGPAVSWLSSLQLQCMQNTSAEELLRIATLKRILYDQTRIRTFLLSDNMEIPFGEPSFKSTESMRDYINSNYIIADKHYNFPQEYGSELLKALRKRGMNLESLKIRMMAGSTPMVLDSGEIQIFPLYTATMFNYKGYAFVNNVETIAIALTKQNSLTPHELMGAFQAMTMGIFSDPQIDGAVIFSSKKK